MEKYSNKELGREGETIAGKMYEEKGFCVKFQNYRCKIGEIDLICEKDKLLVFCEVKSRRSITFGIPSEAINSKKIRHIRRVASWYLSQKMCINRLYQDYDIRFDVMEVVFVNEEYEINHIENAF
jgi:putative endonuclease